MTRRDPSTLPRLNPFRTSKVHALRFRFGDCDGDGAGEQPFEDELESLWRRFESQGRRGALVGPEGSGKTTLLEQIEVFFERTQAPTHKVLRLRLNAERRNLDPVEWQALSRVAPSRLVTVDGAEQMSRVSWWRLRRASRRAAGLLITAHRPGLLPTLRLHRTSPALLHRLVNEATGGEPLPFAVDLDGLFASHGGNLRDCLAELYDLWALTPRPPLPQAATIHSDT